jgi:hypothetical protein
MGYSTLDSIRAVLASRDLTGLDPKPIITLHGFSGGAISSGWATELQPTYAPELDIAGAAIGGISANITAILVEINNSWYTAFSPPTILGIAHDYPEISDWLKENLVPENEADFRKSEHQCAMANMEQYKDLNMDRYFKNGYKSLTDKTGPIIEKVGVMGLRSTPKIPWFLFHNIGDKLSRMPNVEKLYEKHCANGAKIYVRN